MEKDAEKPEEGQQPGNGDQGRAQAETPRQEAGQQPPAQDAEQESAQDAAGEAFDLGRAATYRSAVGKGDGWLELSVADDAMSATADLFPPAEGGAPLAIEQAQDLCARLGIVMGQDWDGLSEAIMRCNFDRVPLRGVVVARGKLPEPAIVEHALASERLRHKPEAAPDRALRYDFHEREAITVVRKGEVLATVVPSSTGEEGYDIHGTVLPAPRVSATGVSAGKNTELRDGQVVALVDGILAPLQADGSGVLSIEEILLIHGDVDYHTGHVVFPGDVVIDGAVRDGFKVWSGATIHCRTTMDAFDVNAKKDLICDQGIIGRRKAQVRVGGQLKAKFVQNCRVAVRGDVHVQTAIAGSRVYSLGRIELGDKGAIMGGEIYAVHGLRAFRLGNQAHQATVIHAGTDFTVQQRLDQANEKLRVLAIAAQRAREESAGRGGPALDHFLEKTKAAEAQIHALIGQLLTSLDADENAVIEVTGEIFPGTVIEICRLTIEIDRLLTACRFRLDKTAGRIVTEHLKGGGKAGAKPQAAQEGESAHAAQGRPEAPAARPPRDGAEDGQAGAGKA